MGGARSSTKQRRVAYREALEALAVSERCQERKFPVVLDFGCGKGRFASYFSDYGSSVIGIEIQRGLLKEVSAQNTNDNVLFVHYGGGVLPIQTDALDLVLAVGVMRSLMDRGPLERALKEWHRCLADEACLLIVETDNSGLRRHIRLDELRQAIVNAGFVATAWYPIRKVRWFGNRLIKWGILPKGIHPHLARWELWLRKRLPWRTGKRAYLGEFRRVNHSAGELVDE